MTKKILGLNLFAFILIHSIFFTLTTLNVYAIEKRSIHLFYLLIIEAMVPLITSKVVRRIISTKSTRFISNLVFSSYFMAFIILSSNIANLYVNLTAGVFFAFSSLVVKSKLTQIIPYISSSLKELNSINSKANLAINFGTLFGYLFAGFVIKHFGYTSLNFSVGLIIVMVATLSEILNKNIMLNSSPIEAAPEVGSTLKSSLSLMKIWLLVIAFWIIGGTINILEVPLATKYYQLDEFSISLLFFFVSAGAIFGSFLVQKIKILNKIFILSVSVFLATIIILLYGYMTSFLLAGFSLFALGILSSVYNIMTNELIQLNSSPSNLAKNSVLNQTITQVTLLLAGSLSSLVADFHGERVSILMFSIIAIIFCFFSTLFKTKKGIG